jgi:hypothetical protein
VPAEDPLLLLSREGQVGRSPPRSRSGSRISGSGVAIGSRESPSQPAGSRRPPARARCVSPSHLFDSPSLGAQSGLLSACLFTCSLVPSLSRARSAGPRQQSQEILYPGCLLDPDENEEALSQKPYIFIPFTKQDLSGSDLSRLDQQYNLEKETYYRRKRGPP